jgi:hypothetical protein
LFLLLPASLPFGIFVGHHFLLLQAAALLASRRSRLGAGLVGRLQESFFDALAVLVGLGLACKKKSTSKSFKICLKRDLY